MTTTGSSPVSAKNIFLAFLVHFSQSFDLFYISKIVLEAFRLKQEFISPNDRKISLCCVKEKYKNRHSILSSKEKIEVSPLSKLDLRSMLLLLFPFSAQIWLNALKFWEGREGWCWSIFIIENPNNWKLAAVFAGGLGATEKGVLYFPLTLTWQWVS